MLNPALILDSPNGLPIGVTDNFLLKDKTPQSQCSLQTVVWHSKLLLKILEHA